MIALILIVTACSSTAVERPRNGAEPERIRLDDSVPDGLSGLTRDGDGVLWASPETNRHLVAIRQRHTATMVPLEGMPEGLDLESIEWMDGHRFLGGTESMDTSRTSDPLVVIEVGGTARVVSQIPIPYAALGIVAEENHGIESLCYANGHAVAIFENVLDEDGRVAPIALVTVEPFAVVSHRLALTTETGKIAGLACRARGSSIDAFAIERHYEVMRVVRFSIGVGSPSTRIRPRLVADLAGALDGDPNLEGLAIDGEDLVLVVDNHYGERSGPNELVVLRHAAR
jgi:hypothetical protein